MDKSLRSSLRSSPQQFLVSASNLHLKSSKTLLKTLIHSIPPNSPLSSSLPSALHFSIAESIDSFTSGSNPDFLNSPHSPPSKRPRCSSQNQRSTPKTDSNCLILLKKLHTFAYVTRLCVSHPKKLFQPSDLMQSVRALHDSLILFEEDPTLMLEIAGLCEEWWRQGWPGRETLISQSLPFLLSRSLMEGKKVDARRVYALRDAFSCFDFDDESIEDLKLLLIRCVIAPLYLKTEEGRRFLASFFVLNGQLAKEVLAIIRAQIPFGRKSMLEAYSDILFRAWKEGGSRDTIENVFLQGLVEGAIHASSGSLAASARRILGGFINQRTTEGVEKLLFRLAEPVLFRSLQVANSNVRQNALHLLLDMFPLEDPDATKETKDTLLHKQFFLLERLLLDECPDVRVVAVEGCCRILRLFWEVIPSSTITKLLTKIIDEMSHDVCTEVRLSTLNGSIYLLENPQTHQILKVLLPRLGHMFLDQALSVRVAVANLLLSLQDIRTFQFNKVVCLRALLSSLSDDHPLVARRITRLLMPSYFPSKVSPKEACSRCVALIRRSPTAGARFCEFAPSEGSSPELLMKLVGVCVTFTLSPKDLNPDQIDGFFIAAANLCQSLSNDMSYKTALNELFSGEKLKRLLTAATTERSRAAVFSIGSMVSPENAAGLVEQSMCLIANCGRLHGNVEKQAEVRAVHKLMLSCHRFDDFIETLVELLRKAAFGCHTKFGLGMSKQCVARTKRKKAKLSMKTSLRFSQANVKRSSNHGLPQMDEDYAFASGIAWQIKDLLASVDAHNIVFNPQISSQALSALKVISQVNIEQCANCELLDTSPVLAYTALTTHMSLHDVGSANSSDLSDGKANSLQSTGLSPEQTKLDQTLNHLVSSTEKLFNAGNSGKSGILHSDLRQGEETTVDCRKSRRREVLADISNTTECVAGGKPGLPETKWISNTVKMATTVLMFVVDATTMRAVSHNMERALKFTVDYIQYIIATLDQNHDYKSSSKDEDLRDAFVCLKSSFTYAAKLLNLVLKNSCESLPPPPEACHLANYLLNLIASIELHIGSRQAMYFVAVAKPWLPDLVLALASGHFLIKATKASHVQLCCPTWVTLLGKAELSEVSKLSLDEQTGNAHEMDEVPVFQKLMGMVILLLKKGNPKILDAIGILILNSLKEAMEKWDFGLVFGLVHFIGTKMVGLEYGDWKDLKLMMDAFQEICIRLEKEIWDPRISEDGRQKLERAKALIESFVTDRL